jgi:single-stranded-DNA-specific exonuclease
VTADFRPRNAAARPAARWRLPEAPDAAAQAAITALGAELRLPAAVCALLARRGYAGVEAARTYLRPRLDQLLPPSRLPDMDAAVARVVRAVQGGEMILVHGDYDVDGMVSTTILVRTLRAFGAQVVPFIPRRLEDGYDLSMAGVRAAVAAGAALVITADCGTNAVEPARALQAAGIDLIIVDHHLPSGDPPVCTAFVNPKRAGADYPDPELAAAGLAFKLALAITAALGGKEDDVFRMLDLVALATVADVAPLRGENRVLARYGLKVMMDSPNPGLRALIRAAGLEGKPLNAGRIGFGLAPRLNAVGRLGEAIRGVQLLCTSDEHEAMGLAREFEELNRRRQDLDQRTLARALAMADKLDLSATRGLVLAEEGWHPGVVGIVASRVVEEFCRPAVLIALEGATGKGSGRSIHAFDLHAGLGECADLLVRYGGHRAAAGVTIETAKLDAFTARFNAVASARLSADDLVPELRVDIEVPLSAATDDLESLLRHLEPFGPGNPAPVFVARGVSVSGVPRTMGKDSSHLKLRLSDGGAELDAIGWGMGGRAAALAAGGPVDIAFRLERDEYKGESKLQAKLADIRP